MAVNRRIKSIWLIFGTPVQGRGFMDNDFFRGQPFHAIGKPEAPQMGKQCAKRGAHAGVRNGAGRQPVVVVGFGKMHQKSVFPGNIQGAREDRLRSGRDHSFETARNRPSQNRPYSEYPVQRIFSPQGLPEKKWCPDTVPGQWRRYIARREPESCSRHRSGSRPPLCGTR